MPVPSKRVSKTRTRTRRAHHALTTPVFALCSHCKKPVRPHAVCMSCGMYRGKNVLKLQKKVERKIAKKA